MMNLIDTNLIELTRMNEEEDMEDKKMLPNCLEIEKPLPNWFIVPEVINRQINSNQLFPKRFYSSLHAVERLEFKYDLNEHQITYAGNYVYTLSFNQKGNLLASISEDLVYIWDWAARKKRYCMKSGHDSVNDAVWLPLDVDNFVVTSGINDEEHREQYYALHLLDLEYNTSKLLMENDDEFSAKLAVHPETPHVVFSARSNSRVLSMDIRESTPNELLVIKEGSSKVRLTSIHCNPSNSNEFCVSGRFSCVNVYDRRNVSKPLYQLCSKYHMDPFRPPYIKTAMYNHNGTEIIAMYNFDRIYLFDKSMWSHKGSCQHVYRIPQFDTVQFDHEPKDIIYLKLKEVNFFGPKSEYIMSGSNSGDIFIYDKNTGVLVQRLTGYYRAVNCLVGHPHIPILATANGSDVRIWMPSNREPPTKASFINNLWTRDEDGIDLCSLPLSDIEDHENYLI